MKPETQKLTKATKVHSSEITVCRQFLTPARVSKASAKRKALYLKTVRSDAVIRGILDGLTLPGAVIIRQNYLNRITHNFSAVKAWQDVGEQLQLSMIKLDRHEKSKDTAKKIEGEKARA